MEEGTSVLVDILGWAVAVIFFLALWKFTRPTGKNTRKKKIPKKNDWPWTSKEVRKWAIISGVFILFAIFPWLFNLIWAIISIAILIYAMYKLFQGFKVTKI